MTKQFENNILHETINTILRVEPYLRKKSGH